jgi:hypothetical protein
MIDLLKGCISEQGLSFQPGKINLDFEIAAHSAFRASFPNATLLCYRFHLGQAWYRNIQKLGSSEYKDTDSKIGKWLSYFFGLSFLNPTEVEDCFAEDLMALAPQNDRCSAFADYVLENYISSGAKFPPILWSEEPLDRRHTTNGCESFHCHFNEQFYTPHPSISHSLTS